MLEIETKTGISPLCAETVKNIPSYVNGTLDLIESLRVDDHLVQCADCRVHYEKEKAKQDSVDKVDDVDKSTVKYAIIDNLMSSPEDNVRIKNEIDVNATVPKRFFQRISEVFSNR